MQGIVTLEAVRFSGDLARLAAGLRGVGLVQHSGAGMRASRSARSPFSTHDQHTARRRFKHSRTKASSTWLVRRISSIRSSRSRQVR
jgi:hypothetical protein